MKKCLAIILGIIMIFLVGCSIVGKSKEKEDGLIIENKPVVKSVNNINLSIDPRIELLSIIIYLNSGCNDNVRGVSPFDSSYKQEIKEWFGDYMNHDAVKVFGSMSSYGFSNDAPPTGMLFLTSTPRLSLREDIDKEDYVYMQCIERAGGEKKFLKFVKALNEFCEESNFYEFYNNHEDYYSKIIDCNIDSLSRADYVSQIENYYGIKQNSYNIILGGLMYSNNYGPAIKGNDGNFDIYSIQGSTDLVNDVPVFGDEDSFQYLVRHEFSHSFVNNLTTKNIDKVNSYEALLKPIENQMSKQGYPIWEISLNEHLVRAVVIRLTEIYDGREKAMNLMDKELQRGFIYIKELTNLLKTEYEANRDKYPVFEDFYPEILKLFESIG